MANHLAAASDYIGDALDARDRLTDLYRLDPLKRDGRLVAALNGELGDALKLAEIHALLDIGAQLRDIRATLETRGPLPL